MASQDRPPPDGASNNYPEVAYAEIQKPPNLEPMQEPKPKPQKKPRKPKKDKSRSPENHPPPVPNKSKELRRDIKSGYNDQHPDNSQQLSQDNPLYDGVLMLTETGKQPRSPLYNPEAKFFGPPGHIDPRGATNAPVPPPRPHKQSGRQAAEPTQPQPDASQFVYDNVNVGRSRLSYEVRAPTGPETDDQDPMVPIYEMAGPIRQTYEDVPIMTPRELPPQPQHTAPRQPPRQKRLQSPGPGGVQRSGSRRVPPAEPMDEGVSGQTPLITPPEPQRPPTQESIRLGEERPGILPGSARSSTRSVRSRPIPPVKPTVSYSQGQGHSVQSHNHDRNNSLHWNNEQTPNDQLLNNFNDNISPAVEQPNIPPKRRSRSSGMELYDQPPRSRRPLQRSDAVVDSVYDDPKPTNQSRISPRNMSAAQNIYDDEVAYGETRAPKPRSRPDVVSMLDTVIVDKRFYNYMCEFWSDQLQPIQTVCEIHTTPAQGKNSNDIEIRFQDAKHNLGADLPQNFIMLYQRLSEQLYIETVNTTSIEDMTAYRNDLESRFKCLCFANVNSIDIICLRTGLEPIRACTERHRDRSSQSPWPVGYDLAGAYNVYLYKADITKLNVDAITNAANEHLRHGGGVAKAISLAAGPDLDRASRDVIKRKKKVPVCNVEKTTAGNLPCRAVLHAVGPRWPKGGREDDQNECRCQLLKTFENVLVTADKEGYRSIAIPPISSGVFGVPHDVVAQAIVDALLNITIKLNRPKLRAVHLVDINDDVLPLVLSRLDQGGLLKVPTGQQVAVARLPPAEVRTATVDQAGYKKMIEHTELSGGKSGSKMENFFTKLMCGAGKKNRPR